MKILHTVEFYSPSVGGAQEVVKQLSEHLVALGHDVTVATTKLRDRKKRVINGVKIREFDISGNAVRGYHGKDILKYQKFLLQGKYDVMMNYAAQQWATDLAFEVIDQIKCRKILVPCGFSGLYNHDYIAYFKKMPAVLKKYDHSVYLSHEYRDIDFAKKHHIKNTCVIPNGADEREFSQIDSQQINNFRKKYNLSLDSSLILNVSNHTGTKGHHETIEVFRKANYPNATLMIVGDINLSAGCYRECMRSAWIYNHFWRHLSLSNNRIIVTKLDRHDTITAYHAADLFLFLSNIECSPLVLFESSASGTPFLASSAGNSQEIASWTGCGLTSQCTTSKHGFTTANTLKYAKELANLMKNESKRRKMSFDGIRSWKSKYTWEKIAKSYEKLYKKS